MKKLLALALLSVAFVGCGNKGGSQIVDTQCVNPEINYSNSEAATVAKILTHSASCSSSSAALTLEVDENGDPILEGVYTRGELGDDGNGLVVSTLVDNTFYTVQAFKIGESYKFIAFNGTQVIEAIVDPDFEYKLTSELPFLHGGAIFIDKVNIAENGDIVVSDQLTLKKVTLAPFNINDFDESDILIINEEADLALISSHLGFGI